MSYFKNKVKLQYKIMLYLREVKVKIYTCILRNKNKVLWHPTCHYSHLTQKTAQIIFVVCC